MDQAQVGDQVFDLATAVEALCADEPVGQAGFEKGFLQRARLGVSAVHHRASAWFHLAAVGQVGDGLDHKPGFVVLIVGFFEGDADACAPIGKQSLLLASKVAVDDRHRCVKYGLG